MRLNMNFPVLTHIDQVREAIKDRPEFIEAEREVLTGTGLYKYHVFNYMVAHTDSFDCPLRRECRGLIFDHEGRVLSRRFHKFFNQGEKPETTNIDLSLPHVVLDKADGSMITPLVFDRKTIRWATKMGVTDIGEMAFNVANRDRNKIDYVWFAVEQHLAGWTPIFEYISPNNRIVLPYQEEKLILLAIRNNITGEYLSYDDMKYVAGIHNIPVIQPYSKSIDTLPNETDIEGVVIRFDSGNMIKIKTDWYVAIHRAKENLLHEKNVLKLILEEKLDDVLPHLMEDDRKRVEKYQKEVIKSVDRIVSDIEVMYDRFEEEGIDRKAFALRYMKDIGKFIASIIFSCWEERGIIREEVIKAFLKHTSTQTSVDSIRKHLKTEWKPMGVVE